MTRFAALFALALTACTVDASFLERRLFTCGSATDCASGWGCARATPYHADFCAQRCDATTCDGICSQGLCLRGCHINPDGTTSACQSNDYECIRVRASDADGICYPVHRCTSTSECGVDEYCLSEIYVDTAGAVPVGYTNFYCVPQETDTTACPAGSIPVPFRLGDAHGLCLATCSTTDRRCPPSFGCEFQYQTTGGGSMSPCFPGLYGVPCEDDTNCVEGHCMDSGSGRYCTVTCEEAGVLAGGAGCGGLVPDNDRGSFYTLKCNPDANGGMNGGLCDVRYTTGFPTCTGDSTSAPGTGGAYICTDGLMCRTITTSTGDAKLCTKSCTASADCNGPGSTRNYCAIGPGANICLAKGRMGGFCAAADGCLPGLTCNLTSFVCE